MEALRLHSADKVFVHLDLADFFGSVSQTRVTRCLKTRLGYEQARWIAKESTVEHPGGSGAKVLPYGYAQSPILASLALYESQLGRVLQGLVTSGRVRVSVYVDDIILSGEDVGFLNACVDEIRMSAARSRFALNEAKTQGPDPVVRAFNVNISHMSMEIAADRLALFRQAVQGSTNKHRTDAIIKYVKIVNQAQGDALEGEIVAP